MLDLTAVAGMIFSLLTFVVIGGFILLYPISRRLGAYLEKRLEPGSGASEAEIRQLREAVASLQQEVERLADRQDFTDRLLTEGSAARPAARLRGTGEQ